MSIQFVHDALPGRVIFSGGSARDELTAEVERLGWSRIMVLATPREARLVKEITADVADRVVVAFEGVQPHVPHRIALEARAAATRHDVDGLVSIGGGSTTGTAKIVALTTELPILAIPTTYAGSEMTPVWGMTTDQRKETGWAGHVLPRVVIYDPELVRSLPADLAVYSALNALAHCLESTWLSSTTPVASAIAIEGARSLQQGLAALVDGGDAAELLLQGAYLAGAAFASTGSGLHHKLCHALGGTLDLPHAETHAAVLPHVLAFNEPGLGDVAERLADALGGPTAGRALSAVYDRVRPLMKPASLRLDAAQIDLVTEVMTAKMPIDNPVPVDRAAVRHILSAAFGG